MRVFQTWYLLCPVIQSFLLFNVLLREVKFTVNSYPVCNLFKFKILVLWACKSYSNVILQRRFNYEGRTESHEQQFFVK